MDRPYDTEGRIIELEAEVYRLRLESSRLAIENLRIVNLLENVILSNGLNKPMTSNDGKYTYTDRLEEVFSAISKIVSRDDS